MAGEGTPRLFTVRPSRFFLAVAEERRRNECSRIECEVTTLGSLEQQQQQHKTTQQKNIQLLPLSEELLYSLLSCRQSEFAVEY